MYEVETKILDVDKAAIEKSMESLGARKIQDVKLTVDWYGPAEIYGKEKIEEGKDPWFLRIRKYSNGKAELTWKGKSEILGASRKHKEINFELADYNLAGEFLEAVGLIQYAHQEKYRGSWEFRDWRFDLDQYPGMPAYLEIEGADEVHIQQVIKLLNLKDHKASSEGERVLIQKEYGLNWYQMQF